MATAGDDRPAVVVSASRGRAGGLVISSPCVHYEPDIRVGPPGDACAACMEIGGTWVHLRQCLVCGRTGCCDLSPNRHATAHFRETGHPMIRSAQPAEDWSWCYIDDRLYVPGDAGPSEDAEELEGRTR